MMDQNPQAAEVKHTIHGYTTFYVLLNVLGCSYHGSKIRMNFGFNCDCYLFIACILYMATLLNFSLSLSEMRKGMLVCMNYVL